MNLTTIYILDIRQNIILQSQFTLDFDDGLLELQNVHRDSFTLPASKIKVNDHCDLIKINIIVGRVEEIKLNKFNIINLQVIIIH